MTASAPVLAADTREELGFVSGVLLHPDRGVVEGFFVQVPEFVHAQTHFVHSCDVLDVGPPLLIRSNDALGDPQEVLRVQQVLSDPRTVLGQPMLTEDGQRLGRCADAQVDAATLSLTWLFPKRWFRWGAPVAAADIVRITPQAILVKSRLRPIIEAEQEQKTTVADVLSAVESQTPSEG